jgi:hypothetical protein
MKRKTKWGIGLYSLVFAYFHTNLSITIHQTDSFFPNDHFSSCSSMEGQFFHLRNGLFVWDGSFLAFILQMTMQGN